MKRFLIPAIFLLALLPAAAHAEILPSPDPIQNIFTATHAVIVRHDKGDTYIVEQSFLGPAKPEDKITLPGFKLITWINDEWERKVTTVPMTDDTRILLYLKPSENDPKILTPTYYRHGYFFRNVKQVDELQALAEKALAYRLEWEKARDLKDPKTRITVLWPYLSVEGEDCRELTTTELAKTKDLAGDYLAERLATSSSNERGSMLLLVRRLPSAKAHAGVLAIIKSSKTRFDAVLTKSRREASGDPSRPNDGTISDNDKNAPGDIYYGLAALASFKDKNDLPFVRDLVPWLVKNHLDESLVYCLYLSRDCPAAENVPLLNSIWQDYKVRDTTQVRQSGIGSGIANSLGAQGDLAGVSTLIDMFDKNVADDSVRSALRALTGQSFETTEAWKDWYSAHNVDANLKPAAPK